jgi:extracellular elastinolytic metalloproteinase
VSCVAAGSLPSPSWLLLASSNAPDVGKRELLKGKAIELDELASPAGWHTVPSSFKGGKDTIYHDTRGNNVIAQDNPSGGNSMDGYRPSGGANLTFDFPLGWPKAGTPLEPSTYINASITQLFYTNNEIHDLFYRCGFCSASVEV